MALANQGNLDEAIEAFRQTVRLDPKNPRFKENLELALERKARRDVGIAPPPRLLGR